MLVLYLARFESSSNRTHFYSLLTLMVIVLMEDQNSDEPLLLRHLPISLVVILGPHSILSRADDSLGIQSSLDLIIQLHLRVIVETVRFRDLIHDAEVCSVFPPTTFCCVVNQGSD